VASYAQTTALARKDVTGSANHPGKGPRASGFHKLYFLAAIAGLTIGTIVWFFVSHWIATSIDRIEDRHPELVGSKRLRVGEAVACGALVLACFALALWIMRLLLVQSK
jgi:hypothetical protein